MDDLATKCLGKSKFLCGDQASYADFVVASMYVNMTLNPRNKWAKYHKESWSKAPDRLKKYIEDF